MKGKERKTKPVSGEEFRFFNRNPTKWPLSKHDHAFVKHTYEQMPRWPFSSRYWLLEQVFLCIKFLSSGFAAPSPVEYSHPFYLATSKNINSNQIWNKFSKIKSLFKCAGTVGPINPHFQTLTMVSIWNKRKKRAMPEEKKIGWTFFALPCNNFFNLFISIYLS